MKTTINPQLKKIMGIAIFAAFAYVMTFFHIPVMFLNFDAKDAVICIGAFLFGAPSGIIIALLVAAIELVTISTTMFWGFLMNFVSSSVFAFTAAFIYSKWKTLNGAIVGIYSSVIATTAVMMLMNLLVTPIYMGVDRQVVNDMLPSVLLPFNLAKSLMNGAIALLIYKPLVVALRRARLLEFGSGSEEKGLVSKDFAPDKFSNKTILTLILGALSIVASVLIFVFLNK